MAGLSGIQPPILTAALTLPDLLSIVRPGQVLQGSIQSHEGELMVHVAGARAPIPEGAALRPGQLVTVEVLTSESGVQLRITPQLPEPPHHTPQTSLTSPTGPTSLTSRTAQITIGIQEGALATLLSSVLAELGALEHMGAASQMLPAHLPANEAAVRLALALFLAEPSTGADLQLIAAVLRQAAEMGVIPTRVAGDFLAVASQFVAAFERPPVSSNAARGAPTAGNLRQADRAPVAEETPKLQNVLRRVTELATRPTEARVAAAVARGAMDKLLDEVREDLRTHLAHIRASGPLSRHLSSTGQLRPFEQAVERVLARQTGVQLLNLRALEGPYVFFEVPFGSDTPIRRAQVHFFGDSERGKPFDPQNASVMLDLATTMLGDLWISLSVTRGQCVCRFGVCNEAAAKVIKNSSAELVAGLADAGYPGAQMYVVLWDGDRMAETARLMRRFAGLDVRA